LHEAKNNKIISKVNINKFKSLPVPDADKIFIKVDESRELIKFYKNYPFKSIKNENSFNAFLFCCFTGLRIGDVEKIKYSDIINKCWNNFGEEKTTFKRTDLIFDIAFSFIDTPTIENQDRKIFYMLSQQKTRQIVKQVIADFNDCNEKKIYSDITIF